MVVVLDICLVDIGPGCLSIVGLYFGYLAGRWLVSWISVWLLICVLDPGWSVVGVLDILFDEVGVLICMVDRWLGVLDIYRCCFAFCISSWWLVCVLDIWLFVGCVRNTCWLMVGVLDIWLLVGWCPAWISVGRWLVS